MERESLLNYNLILPINVSWYFIPNAHTSQRAKATRSNSQKARSRQYLPNKKDPSFDESSLYFDTQFEKKEQLV